MSDKGMPPLCKLLHVSYGCKCYCGLPRCMYMAVSKTVNVPLLLKRVFNMQEVMLKLCIRAEQKGYRNNASIPM